MSGPKYNAYILEQRRRLELQRKQEEERKKREEEKRRAIEAERKRQLSEKLKEIAVINDEIQKEIEALNNEKSDISRLAGFIDISEWQQKYLMVSRQYAALKRKIKSVNENNSLEQVISALNVIEKSKENIKFERISIIQSSEELKNKNKDISEKRISEAFSKSLSFEVQKNDAEEIEHYDITIQQVYDRLFALKDNRLSKELSETIDSKLQYLMDINDAGAKNFMALTLKPLEEDIKRFLDSIDEYEKKLLELKPRYLVLCEETGTVPENFTATEVSINYLMSEIKRLEQLSMEFAERECIETAVNEVMTDMGYFILGKCIKEKKTGTKLRKSLYKYDDDTAVNVTYSSGDYVIMEIGKMDTKDRLPDEAESNQLETKMEEFCSNFNEIECRLKEKGVLLKKRIKMLPPTIEHAQIINISEYESNGECVAMTHKRKSSVTKKERTVD